MKVLIACEYSGVTRKAFEKLGHTVWSADFEPSDDSAPNHYQGDCFDLIEGWEPVNNQPIELFTEFKISSTGIQLGKPKEWQQFDLMIAHPPCTYLTVSGLHWNKRGVTVNGIPRSELTEQALEFVRRLLNAPIEKIALENPISCISSRIRKPDQIIQPYQFGEDASKATCLWLKNLPLLTPTKLIIGRIVHGKERWSNQTPSGQNKLGPSKNRWKERSKTYPGIAEAWANQWS